MFFKKFRKEIGPDDCYNFALKYVRIILADPNASKDWHFYLFQGIYIAATAYTYYLIILLFFHMEGTVENISNAAQSFISYFQTVLNIYPIIVYRKSFGKLFRSRAMLWKNNDPDLHKDLTETYTSTYRSLMIFLMFIACTETIFILKPIFIKELFVAMYIPSYSYAYEFLLIIQYLYSLILGIIVFAVNGTCISLFTDAIGQFKILNHTILNIRRIKNADEMSELKRCLKHHTFLLKFVSDVQRIYSIPWLGQYLLTIGATCMNLYILISDFSDGANKALSASFIVTLNLQFGLYCFKVTSLAVAIEQLPNSFYFNNWEDGTKEFRQSMILCIMKAQKEFVFKAGGMTEIYRGAVTSVFKTSYSFFLIMQNMKAQK